MSDTRDGLSDADLAQIEERWSRALIRQNDGETTYFYDDDIRGLIAEIHRLRAVVPPAVDDAADQAALIEALELYWSGLADIGILTNRRVRADGFRSGFHAGVDYTRGAVTGEEHDAAADRAALTATLEQMRPVVDAALGFCRVTVGDTAHFRILDAAVRAYNARRAATT